MDRATELQKPSLRGSDSRPVIAERAAKSIGEENTFETDTLDREKVSAVLTAHADEVARQSPPLRLRRFYHHAQDQARHWRAKRREARVGGGDEPVYPLLTRSKTMRSPTDDGRDHPWTDRA